MKNAHQISTKPINYFNFNFNLPCHIRTKLAVFYRLFFGKVCPKNSPEIGQFFCQFALKIPRNLIFFLRPIRSPGYMFLCTTFNNIPIILILLTNKNTVLIYLVTICEQKTNDNCVWREGAPNINSSTGTIVFIFGVEPLLSPLFSTNYDKAIHRINLYPVDSALLVSILQCTYPLDNDLSSG